MLGRLSSGSEVLMATGHKHRLVDGLGECLGPHRSCSHRQGWARLPGLGRPGGVMAVGGDPLPPATATPLCTCPGAGHGTHVSTVAAILGVGTIPIPTSQRRLRLRGVGRRLSQASQPVPTEAGLALGSPDSNAQDPCSVVTACLVFGARCASSKGI